MGRSQDRAEAWNGALREMDVALEQIVKGWGPVAGSRNPVGVMGRESARAVSALAAVEIESRSVIAKVRLLGLHRIESIDDFSAIWQAEEAEHGRRLKEISSSHSRDGLPDGAVASSGRARSLAELKSGLALTLVRLLGRRVAALTFFTHGAIQEFNAMIIYRHLAKGARGEVAQVLTAIAAQEARHLRYFAAGARAVPAGRCARALAAMILRVSWSPPGYDFLGQQVWISRFGPILSDAEFRSQALRMDSLFRSLLGVERGEPMGKFLASAGYLSS